MVGVIVGVIVGVGGVVGVTVGGVVGCCCCCCCCCFWLLFNARRDDPIQGGIRHEKSLAEMERKEAGAERGGCFLASLI